ncbi:MAG: glycosyltransferase family 2 protein [Erysipelotrichaceae bacterium]|nr:glycosyltransferase family 2 protein [Erysipelotrichaceae bacterium]
MFVVTVSVIVAAYNIEKYINRCIDSILGSTYTNLQVIVIDDGSTDATGRLLDEYEDERLHVLHIANRGVSGARNVGLDMITGEYVLFVDGDDYIDQNMIAEMVEHILDQDIIETTQYFANDTKTWRKPYQTSLKINEYDLQVNKEACLYLTLAPHSRLYRSELVKDVRFPIGLVFEDNHFVSMLFPKLRKVTKLDTEHGYFHYQRVGSTTMTFNDKIFDMLPIQEKILEDFRLNGMYDTYRLILEKNAVHDLLYSTIGRKFAHYQGQTDLLAKYREITSFVSKNYPEYVKNPYLSKKEKLICNMIMHSYLSSKVVMFIAKVCGY